MSEETLDVAPKRRNRKTGDAIITEAPQKYFMNCPHCIGRIFNSQQEYEWFDFQIWDGTYIICYHCDELITVPEEWIRMGIAYRNSHFIPKE